MICIFDHSTDPAFNLAAEEYVLKNFSDDVFMLWRNANAIIVGKHQNTLSEINSEFVKANEIKVIRRLSGGGAVFHDLGNLNFTFIRNGEGEKLIDFRKYTLPILEVMLKLEIPARFEGRNDLTINDLKFSGNAEHIYKKRVLHHGTLLFSSRISDLTQALNSKPDKFRDKSVKSVRSRVTNISEHLKQPLDVMQFASLVKEHIMEMYPDAVNYSYSAEDIRNIEKLKKEKYDTWEWNFGYSPDFSFRHSILTSGGTIEVAMDVDKGVISDILFTGDFFNKRDVGELVDALKQKKYQQEIILEVMEQHPVDEYFVGVSKEEFIRLLFDN